VVLVLIFDSDLGQNCPKLLEGEAPGGRLAPVHLREHLAHRGESKCDPLPPQVLDRPHRGGSLDSIRELLHRYTTAVVSIEEVEDLILFLAGQPWEVLVKEPVEILT